jgi:AmiR/NasT family two-component response regulator
MTSWNRHSEVVAQASGMVSVQANCSLDDAFVRIQERAQSTGKTAEEIAKAVVERRMRFAPLSD